VQGKGAVELPGKGAVVDRFSGTMNNHVELLRFKLRVELRSVVTWDCAKLSNDACRWWVELGAAAASGQQGSRPARCCGPHGPLV
jgi:hypothetical protein